MKVDRPHPKLIPLLEKNALSWEQFSKRGRLPADLQWVVNKRSSIITEVHAAGTPWKEIIEITGLSLGSIERLTKAMWNSESRKNASAMGVKTGKAWKGKKRPGQLERQWAAGNFDAPSTRAKYSMAAIQNILNHPKWGYPQGIREVVNTLKGKTAEVRVRSSYEKKAIEILDNALG
jgi:hypothetical protein